MDKVGRRQWTGLWRLTRGVRRGAVIAAYLGYLAMIGGWSQASRFHAVGLYVLVLVLGLVMLMGLSVLLSSWVWNAANQADERLDERQQKVRDRAYLQSYRVLGSVVLVVTVYAVLAYDNSWWWPRSGNQTQAVMWGVLLLVITLPTAVIAWTSPDFPIDESGDS